ncbi:7553_t:CDS:2, partial [Acaulospora morrowiae]
LFKASRMEVRVLGKFISFGEQHIRREDPSETCKQNQPPNFLHKRATKKNLYDSTSKFGYKLYRGFDRSAKESNDNENVEELFVENNLVIWSRGNVLQKSFKFTEPVIQALFVWFNATDTCGESKFANRHGRQRALFVLLEDYAKVYLLDGQNFLIRIPSPVRRAWAMDIGVILQCVVDDKSYPSVSNLPSGSLPTLYSLLDPLEEIRSLTIAEKIITDGSKINIKGRTQLFTDTDEVVIFVNDRGGDGNPILVTLNSITLRHSVYKYAIKNKENNLKTRSGGLSSYPTLMRRRSSSNTRAEVLQNFDGRISCGIEDSFQSAEGRSSFQSMDRLLYSDHDEIFNDLRIRPDAKSDVFLELIWTESIAKIERFEASDVFIAHDYDGHEILCIFSRRSKDFMALDICASSHDLQISAKFEFKIGAAAPVIATRTHLYDMLFIREGEKNSTLELWIGYGKLIPLNLDYNIIKSGFESDGRREELSRKDVHVLQEAFSQQLFRKYLVSTQNYFPPHSNAFIIGLRDYVCNRVNLVFSNCVVRVSLSFLPNSKLVRSCLEALSYVLPTGLFFDFKAQYMLFQYGTNEKFSDIQRGTEWENFVTVLFSFIHLMGQDFSGYGYQESFKKLETSDWDFLMASSRHTKFNFNTHFQCLQPPIITKNCSMIKLLERSQKLHCASFTYYQRLEKKFLSFLPSILLSLHLVYQDLRLNVLLQKFINDLIPLLIQLAYFLGWDAYIDYYQRNFEMNQKFRFEQAVITESRLPDDHPFFIPPDIFRWILKCLRHEVERNDNFPDIKDISQIFSVSKIEENLIHDFDCCSRTRKVSLIYNTLVNEGERSTILEIVKIGFSIKDIDSLPFGVAIPLREAIRTCRDEPPSNWPGEAYILIGREDLAELSYGVPIGYIHTHGNKMESKPRNILQIVESAISASSTPTAQDHQQDSTGTEISNHEISDLRFGNDKRLFEVQLLLQSCNVVKADVPLSDLSIQNEDNSPQMLEKVQVQCLKNFSQPVGRGILTYGTATPIVTEPFPIPGFSASIKVSPFNSLIEVGRAIRLPESIEWPEFHDGVASGLRIPSTTIIEGSWISLNKPKELNNSHAGFLLGLGLNGHLKSMATWQAVDYLMKTPKHDITTIALVLGLPASYIGTMNTEITKFVAVHVTAMFPPKSTSLNVSPLVQTASILGCGLLYMETCNRYMSQIMLAEISTRALKTSDSSETDFTEGYSLAAGLALGFVNLGHGDNACESIDLDLFKELRLYIAGGAKKPQSANESNVNITSPGATIALGLLYLKTGKVSVANKIPIPEAEFFLDYMRPDFLLVRTLARNLIMWDDIRSTQTWVESHIPQYMKAKLARSRELDCENLESIRRSYYYILAGACFSMSLKFAGSADKNALKCLLHYLDLFMGLESERSIAPTFDENITLSAIKICLNVLATCTSIVAAGTGNLEVMRRIRKLHKQEVDTVNSSSISRSYGTHMMTSMALGFLFLGGGNYTLSTSNRAIAGLVCSLFPRYPIETYDNRAHLQAFRHLWVLAVEPRCLVLRDIETREVCHVPVKIVFNDMYNAEILNNGIQTDTKTKESVAPCLLPESKFIQKIEIDSPRYWPMKLEFGKNAEFDQRFWKNSTLYVKRKIGHLTYAEDPQGLRNLFTRIFPDGNTLLGATNSSNTGQKKLDFIGIFSSDPQVQAFSRYLCEDFSINADGGGQDLLKFCNVILSECLNADKVEAIQIYLELYQIQKNLIKMNELNLWNVILIFEYYKSIGRHQDRHQKDEVLIKQEYISSLRAIMNRFFEIPFEIFKLSSLNNVTAGVNQDHLYFAKLLKSYFANTEFPPTKQLENEENSEKVLKYFTSWLIYHEIPDRYNLLSLTEHVRKLKGRLNVEVDNEMAEDAILQVFSTLWSNLSSNTLKIILYCITT